MQSPPLDPAIVDVAPDDNTLSVYDEEHIITYMRLLDAEAAGADWREAAKFILNIDPLLEPDRASLAWTSHIKRAKWMTANGYRHLLRASSN